MLPEDVTRRLAAELALPHQAVAQATDRLEAGQSPSYLARYEFPELQLGERPLRDLERAIRQWREFAARQKSLAETFESRGLLDESVAEALERCATLRDLDDYYGPLRPGKDGSPRRLSMGALDPLAQEILAGQVAQDQFDDRLQEFVRGGNETTSTESVGGATAHSDEQSSGENHDATDSSAEQEEGTENSAAPTDSSTADAEAQPASRTTAPRRPFGTLEEARRALREAVSVRLTLNIELRGVLRETFWDRALLTAGLTDELAGDPEPPRNERPRNDRQDAESVEPTAVTPTNDLASTPTLVDIVEGGGADATDPAQSGSAAEAAAPSPESEAAGGEANSSSAGDASDEASSDEDSQGESHDEGEASDEGSAVGHDGKGGAAGRTSAAAEQRRAAKRARRHRIIEGYRRYFDFQSPLAAMQEHAWLELHRAQQNNVLRTSFEIDHDLLRERAESLFRFEQIPAGEFVRSVLRETLEQRLIPQLERDARRRLSDGAERVAFETQLRTLECWMGQPPVQAQKILAVDPGRRSGCALVVLDGSGAVVDHSVVPLLGRQEQVDTGRDAIRRLITEHQPDLLVLAVHGGWRDAERLLVPLCREIVGTEMGYLLVHAAGAWEYAIAAIGKEELPRLDPSLRAAVNIGRRALDPLRELSKLSPQTYPVGLQHEGLLTSSFREWLDEVLPSLVGLIGVDVNTAPASLLKYVPGLDGLLAVRIVERRTEKGLFQTRDQIREISGMNDLVWQQAAGLLRISDSPEPLDRTWLHPSQYDVARRLLDLLQIPLNDLLPPIEAKVATRRAFAGQVLPDETDASDPTETPSTEQPTASVESTIDESTGEGSPDVEGSPEAATVPPVAADETSASEAVEPQPAVEQTAPVVAKSVEPPVPMGPVVDPALVRRLWDSDPFELARALDVDPVTVAYLVHQLADPGLDPRRMLPETPVSRVAGDVTQFQPGMLVVGQVRKLLDFGAFLDLGDGRQALLPVGQMTGTFVKHPSEILRMGDVVLAWVSKVDRERGQVTVTTRPPDLVGRLNPIRPPRPPREARSTDGRGQGRPPRNQNRDSQGGEGAFADAGREVNRGGGQGGPDRGGRGGDRGPRQGAARGGQGGRGRGPGGPRPGGPPQGGGMGRPTEKPSRATFHPSANLTPDMEKGKEPMRSFADLKQLFQKRTDDDGDAPKSS